MTLPIIPHVFSNRKFIKLWTSQVCTVVGINIVNYVLLLRLYDSTNSTLAASFLWIAFSLPVLLVGPFASTIVDLVNRKRLLSITTLLQSLTILLFLFTGDRYFLIYAIMFLYSLVSQFYGPSESATLPLLVPKEDLAEATGIFLFTGQVGRLFGFGVAGFLAKFIGFHPTLIVCSMLLGIAFLSILSLPIIHIKKPVNVEQDLSHFFEKVIEGYQYIKNNRYVLYPLMLSSGSEITMLIIAITIPAIAKEIIRIPPEDAALYVIIPAMFGAMTGIYTFSRLLRRGIRKIAIIQKALFGLMTSFLTIGLVLEHIPLSYRLLLLPVLSFAAGISFTGIQVPSQTYLQETTPKDMLGRLWGNLWFAMTIVTIIPMFLSASLTEFLGVHTLFILLAIGIAVVFWYTKKHTILVSLPPPKEEK
jgi:DHA3 family macrolide efflux protein-like MFS transporter